MNLKRLIKKLTIEEKVSLVSGFDNWYTKDIKRLGIPKIKMSDGPNGVRGDSNTRIRVSSHSIRTIRHFNFWNSQSFNVFRIPIIKTRN